MGVKFNECVYDGCLSSYINVTWVTENSEWELHYYQADPTCSTDVGYFTGTVDTCSSLGSSPGFQIQTINQDKKQNKADSNKKVSKQNKNKLPKKSHSKQNNKNKLPKISDSKKNTKVNPIKKH